MDDKTNDFLSEYLSELCLDFDESTLISSNKNGEKEKGMLNLPNPIQFQSMSFYWQV